MKKLLRCIFLCLLISQFSWAQDGSSWWNTDYNTTEGTEFFVTFMYNYGKQVDDEDLVLTLYATAREKTHITIYGTWTDFVDESYTYSYVKSFDVEAGKVDSIFIPNQVAYLQESNQTEKLEWLNKGLRVVSEKPISLYAHNADASSYDASLIIPLQGLYKEYVIQTFSRDAEATEFAIVATKATTIDIDLHETNAKGELTRTPIHISLGAHQSYSYRPLNKSISLTGTTICSQEPIAVFQGGQHAKVPYDADGASHIFTQTYSTDFWGKEHIATRTHNQDIDIVRITAAENNTIIYRNGIEVKTIQALETYEDKIEWKKDEYAVYYKTTKAVCCYLYHSSADYNDTQKAGSPAVTPITPQEQGIRSVIVAPFDEMSTLKFAPDLTTEEDLKNYKHYVNIVVSTKDVNSMKIGDKDISLSFYSIEGTPYSVATCELTEKSQLITNNNATFTARVYGQMEGKRPYTSYAYSAGSRVSHSADFLMNDEYTDTLRICENDTVSFEPIVRYDYDHLSWSFVDSTHVGYDTIITRSGPYYKRICPNSYYSYSWWDCYYQSYYKYDTVYVERFGKNQITSTEKSPIITFPYDGTWNVNLFVTRKTPLCNNEIVDTIKATVIAYPVYNQDQNAEDGGLTTLCYGDEPITVKYNEGDVHKQLLVQPDTLQAYYNNEKWKLDSIYEFVDSLKTGLTGCDSIVHQLFVIRPTYDTTIYDTICYESLPYQWTDQSSRISFSITEKDLINHSKFPIKEEKEFYVDSIIKDTTLQTIYGCDSVVHIHWLVLPNYELIDKKEVCADSLNSYTEWAGHIDPKTGKPLTNHHLQKKTSYGWEDINCINISEHGTFTYRDNLTTKNHRCKTCYDNLGCDSTWILTLTVKEYDNIIQPAQTICDDGYIFWEGEYRLGPKCPIPTDGKPYERYNATTNLTSVHPASNVGVCDKTYNMRLVINPTYRDTIDTTICYNQLPFVWIIKDTKGVNTKATFQPKWSSSPTHIDSTYILSTKAGCDSIVTLHLHIYPTYQDTIDTIVCQTPQSTLDYTMHNPKGVFSVNSKKWVTTIPFDKAGQFTYIDSLKTTTCSSCHDHSGCDSVWVINLTVSPVFDTIESRTLCENDTIHWHGRVYTGGKASADKAVESEKRYWASPEWTSSMPENQYRQPYTYREIQHLWSEEKLTDSIHLQTSQGCDSIYWLRLTVNPTFIIHKEDRVCSPTEQSYDFDGKKVTWKHIGDTTYVKELTTSDGCDSIVYLTLHVDSAYFWHQDTTICRNTHLVWKGHPDTIHINTSFVGDYTYYDRQTTIHGCDSIYELTVHIYPIYETTTLNQNICITGSVTWEGQLYAGKQSAEASNPNAKIFDLGTFQDAVTHTSIHGCDSICRMILQVKNTDTTNLNYHHCTSEKSITYEKKTYDISYQRTINETFRYTTALGCDSIVILHIEVDSAYLFTEDSATCQVKGGTYTWHQHPQNGRKLYCVETLQHVSSISLDVAGQFTYIDSIKTCPSCSSEGCDSVHILNLHIWPTYNHITEAYICEGESFDWDGATWKGTAHYQTDTLMHRLYGDSTYTDLHKEHHYFTKNGYTCDSIETLELHVYPRVHTAKSKILCDDEGYDLGDKHFDARPVGLYHDICTIISSKGCDSVLSMDVQVTPTYFFSDTAYISDKGSVRWIKNNKDTVVYGENCPDKPAAIQGLTARNQFYFFPDSLHTTYGCDSVLHKYILVRPTFNHVDTDYVCQNEYESYPWESHTTTTRLFDEYGNNVTSIPTDIAGTFHYTDSLKTVSGDDSLFVLCLIVYPTYDKVENITQCENEDNHRFIWNITDTYGTYQHKIKYPIIESKDVKGEIKDTLFRTLTDTLHTIYGCDSIVTLQLTIYPTYTFGDTIHVCQDTIETLWEWKENKVSQGTYPINHAGTFEYGKRYKSIHNCDSIYGITLIVDSVYYKDTLLTICENDTVSWQGVLFVGNEFSNYGKSYDATFYDSVRTNMKHGEYSSTIKYKTTITNCDSTYHARIVVLPIYRTTTTIRTCQSKEGYYYPHLHNGQGGILSSQWLSDSLTRNDTVGAMVGCDSIITLHFIVDSVYHYTKKDSTCQVYGGTWEWKNEFGDSQGTISVDVGDTTIFRGVTYKTQFGCDSTFGVELYIRPIYHFYDTLSICESDSISWQGLWFSGKQFKDYNPSGFDASVYRRSQADLAFGQYKDTAWYKTYLDCDSIYHLVLNVHEVPHVSIDRRVCQSKDDYWYECENRGEGGYLPSQRVGTYIYVDTIQTVLGCDSIITLTFHVDSVYDYRQQLEVCQDTINFQWEWIDDEEHSHGYIDISESGDFSFEEKYTTIYGCDSIYGLQLHVKPIYRFDSIYSICENERITWQNKTYTGDSVLITPNDSIILPPGTYYDTAHYTTWEECDSTYYLVLHVHAIYDTLTITSACANEGYIWHQSDYRGLYHDTLLDASKVDTILLHPYQADIHIKQLHKDTAMLYAQKMLHTIYDCDSLSRLKLTINPSYFFLSDTFICRNEEVKYRGKYFSHHDTTYIEHLYTTAHCDSIYCLRVHVIPDWSVNINLSTCDNEAIYHNSPVHGDNYPIWTPGTYIPDPVHEPINIIFTRTNGCDSTYRYYVTVHPTYFYLDSADLCSGELYPMHEHLQVGLDTIYDPIVSGYVPTVDSLFTDSLNSTFGCDSIYWLQAQIRAQYYHLDYDTICDDGAITWQGHTYFGNKNTTAMDNGLSAGSHIIFDSLTTHEGCDSIYELRLQIYPTYSSELSDTMCADDSYDWQYRHLQHLSVGLHHFDTTYTTIHGCDSIFKLHLLVLDTTAEYFDDTICYTDTFFLYNKIYTHGGYYKDTTLNEWGCHNFVYLHLTEIPPTYYTLNIPDICADDEDISISYEYEGLPIIEYSIYFDSLGHAQGFHDIDHASIDMLEDPQIITIPIPHGDTLRHPTPTYFDSKEGVNQYTYDYKYQYPEPNDYHVKVILGNGICSDRLQQKDTVWKIYYPSWIHEQHWNDGIVLYNELYNGNYTFDQYQWYCNDQPIIGQTREFLYWPDSLNLNQKGESPCVNEYKVLLRRSTDGYSTFTCPICPVQIYDHIVPQKDYFSIVPTLVVMDNPVVWILTTEPLRYRVFDPATGVVYIPYTHVAPDDNNYAGSITLPAKLGVMGVELITDRGEQRVFWVLEVK